MAHPYSSLNKEIDGGLPNDSDDRDEEPFYEEPPCLCAQQIISTLFAVILGYLVLLLTPSGIYFPIALTQV
jgi:hypothetical protein